MSSLQALRAGDLAKAWEDLKTEVKREPAVAKHRIFMFQLAAVLGDWDRALTQLNVAREMDSQCLPMAQTYQELIHCEALRKKIFAGERSPLFFGEPEPWMAIILEATKLSGRGKHAEAQKLRSEALEEATVTSGFARLRDERDAAADDPSPGERFEWIADADSRLGPMLEAVVNGRYYWIPFSRMRRVEFEKPTDLRDFVWLPSHFEWTNGGEAVGFVPVRYPGSEANADDQVRLARKTVWEDAGDDIYLGRGQRVLATDQNEYSLFDLRQLMFDEVAAPPA